MPEKSEVEVSRTVVVKSVPNVVCEWHYNGRVLVTQLQDNTPDTVDGFTDVLVAAGDSLQRDQPLLAILDLTLIDLNQSRYLQSAIRQFADRYAHHRGRLALVLPYDLNTNDMQQLVQNLLTRSRISPNLETRIYLRFEAAVDWIEEVVY